MKHLAVVGCGRVFERYYLPALAGTADWRLVAAADPDPTRRELIGRRLAGVPVYPSLTEVPSAVRVDVVLIATPPESHLALATEAIGRGAHVLIEKPLAPNRADAEAIVQWARARHRQVLVGFNRRFRPSYEALRGRLRWAAPGRIVSVEYDLRSDITGWSPVSGYLGDEARGGGVLDDIASHQLDLLPWLLGAPVTEVSARPDTEADPSDPARAVVMTLRLGGVEATCRASHVGPTAERLEIRLADGLLLATRGTALHTGWLPVTAARRLAAARDGVIGAAARLACQPSVTFGSFRRQLAEWARALDAGESETAAGGADGARCAALVDACRASIARGGAWQTPLLPAGG